MEREIYKVNRTVRITGVEVMGNIYWHIDLMSYLRKDVEVRYLLTNIKNSVSVYHDDKFICEAKKANR